jgi:transposase
MNIAIDIGKKRSYVVMKEDGDVVKEGYVETTQYGFSTFFGATKAANVIIEASSTSNRVASFLSGYNIIVAHPVKVRAIAEGVKKTDKIDAHVLLDLYEAHYLPTGYLAPVEIREARDLCRARDMLVKHRTAVKNSIKYHTYNRGIDFKNFNKRSIEKLKSDPLLSSLVSQLESFNTTIRKLDDKINAAAESNANAKLVDSVIGIGKKSALAIAAEIGDVNRFADESRIFAYAGLVPRIYQSGENEYRGHIHGGDAFLRTLLVECVQMHIRLCPNSFITRAYYRIKQRSGYNKAKIAAARKLLQLIYVMLKRNEAYNADL